VIITCSYCRQVYGEKEPLENSAVSHGICPVCWDYHMPQIMELNLSEHLDQYESPIIMVEEEGRVIGLNMAMVLFLGTTREQSLGLLGGELMECRYARLSEGCGNTIHCSTCAIRQTVNNARESKADLLGVPAWLDRDALRIHFLISAYRRKEFVKVVVDKLVGTQPLPPS